MAGKLPRVEVSLTIKSWHDGDGTGEPGFCNVNSATYLNLDEEALVAIEKVAAGVAMQMAEYGEVVIEDKRKGKR